MPLFFLDRSKPHHGSPRPPSMLRCRLVRLERPKLRCCCCCCCPVARRGTRHETDCTYFSTHHPIFSNLHLIVCGSKEKN